MSGEAGSGGRINGLKKKGKKGKKKKGGGG